MKKYLKFEAIFGVIPVISAISFFCIFFTTMILFKIKKAKLKLWIFCIAAIVTAFFLSSYFDAAIPEDKGLILQIADWLVFSATNIFCVWLQSKLYKQENN
jgi:hypothetical protein